MVMCEMRLKINTSIATLNLIVNCLFFLHSVIYNSELKKLKTMCTIKFLMRVSFTMSLFFLILQNKCSPSPFKLHLHVIDVIQRHLNVLGFLHLSFFSRRFLIVFATFLCEGMCVFRIKARVENKCTFIQLAEDKCFTHRHDSDSPPKVRASNSRANLPTREPEPRPESPPTLRWWPSSVAQRRTFASPPVDVI